MVETERRNKILQNGACLSSRRQEPNLRCPALTQCLHLAFTQYIGICVLINWLKVRTKENQGLQVIFCFMIYFAFFIKLAKNSGSIKSIEHVKETNIIPGKDNEFRLGSELVVR